MKSLIEKSLSQKSLVECSERMKQSVFETKVGEIKALDRKRMARKSVDFQGLVAKSEEAREQV